MAPKRSAVNEEGEHPCCFLPSIISFLLFQPNSKNKKLKQRKTQLKDKDKTCRKRKPQLKITVGEVNLNCFTNHHIYNDSPTEDGSELCRPCAITSKKRKVASSYSILQDFRTPIKVGKFPLYFPNTLPHPLSLLCTI